MGMRSGREGFSMVASLDNNGGGSGGRGGGVGIDNDDDKSDAIDVCEKRMK